MKIFKELTRKKGDRSGTAQLEAVGSSWVAWKITLTLFIDGRKIASEEKFSFDNEWKIRLEHSGFTAYAQREFNLLEDSKVYFSLE